MTMTTGTSTAQVIRARLAALEPDVLELYDESGEHIGHAGARDGAGHYRLLIASSRFRGMAQLARHRLIYQALADLMQRQIHALAISAYTPEEMEAAFPAD
jgi:BolA family transcriptional regulator, general stress-responsive regulator